jgi:hypothetical protein
VAILQRTPKPDYIDWIAERLSAEKPFVGYHASIALLIAVRTLCASDVQELRNAILESDPFCIKLLHLPGLGFDRAT